MIGGDAEHDAIGLEEVVDGGALFQELRIAAEMEGQLRVLRDRGLDLVRRADGHGRLGDDDDLARHVLADELRDGEHVAEVGGAVFVGRRADGDEDDLRAGDGRGHVGGELEAPLRLIALDELVEAGLVDRKDVLLESFDLGDVEIGAVHVIAGLGETGADDQADVAGSDDGDAHAVSVWGLGNSAEKRYSR